MSLILEIIQQPLPVTESHSDHTWNIALNDYSAYTDIRLVVDVYKNPYGNDLGPNNTTGTIQDTAKIARLLIPSNQYGNCIFNVETIIRDIVKANPRNMDMIYNPSSAHANTTPYLVDVMQSNLVNVTGQTSQATLVNGRPSTIGFSNGFNGGYAGFESIFQINEYRLIFGVQYTNTANTTTVIIDTTNYNVYTTGATPTLISPYSAATQPYGVTIWPGVQDNKQLGVSNNPSFTPYYSGNNLDGRYNYWNTKVFDYAMNTGIAPYNQDGRFMATFGANTIPMTSFGSSVQQTRYRTHYYTCPILLPFMYGKNQLFNNSSVVNSITYLQKSSNNNQMNYDTAQSVPVGFTTGAHYLSFLGQRIAYAIFKENPNVRTTSDVAIFASSGTCDPYGTNRVSEIVQYKMLPPECFNDPVSFMFINRQGVWDTYTFTKKHTKTYQPNKKSYNSLKSLNTQVWNRQSYDTNATVYYGDAEEMFTVDSSYVAQNDREIIEGLLMSPNVYMIMNNWTPEKGQTEIYPYLIPCLVSDSEVHQFEYKYDRLYQYTIQLKQVPYRKFYLPF